MFKDYYKDFPLLSEKKSEKKHIRAEKAAVFARIETEGKFMKNTPENNFENIEANEPSVVYPQKISAWRRIMPAAAAAVLAAAIPIGITVVQKREDAPAPIAPEYSSEGTPASGGADSAAAAPGSSDESSETDSSPTPAPSYADIPIEYRYSKEMDGQGKTSISTVNIDGRVYAASTQGTMPEDDKDGSGLERIKDFYGIDEPLTYEQLRALPSIGKGRMLDGLALTDLSVPVQFDDRYYCKSDFCRYSDDILIMRTARGSKDVLFGRSLDLSDLDSVPDDEIQYCFLCYSERQTKAAAAANKLYEEWKGANEYGIVDMKEVLHTGAGESRLFTEVTLGYDSDRSGFAEYLDALGVAPENAEIVIASPVSAADLPTGELTEILRQERPPMKYFLFNGVEYDVTEHGSIHYNGEYEEIEYDNTFKARGLRVALDANNDLVISETDENPDIYYFEFEVPEENFPVNKFAYVLGADGNVRIVLGNEARNIHISDDEDGVVLWDNQTSTIDWRERAEKEKQYKHRIGLKIYGGGGVTIDKDGILGGSLGRKINKDWYIVNPAAAELLQAFDDRIEGCCYYDIFLCKDGGYRCFITSSFDKFMEVQYGAYGAVNPYKAHNTEEP